MSMVVGTWYHKDGTVTRNGTRIKYFISYRVASQDISANTSSVEVRSRIQRIVSSWNFDTVGTRNQSITIDGHTQSWTMRVNCNPWPSNPYTLGTRSRTITHNSNGKKSITISARSNGHASDWGYSDSTSSSGDATASITIDLPDIPRASLVDAPDTAIESVCPITITRYSSSYTHDLTYTIAGNSYNIATGVSTSHDWTVPSSVYALIPNAKTTSCTITCQTYNGGTLVGTTTKEITLTASEELCKPTVNATIEDVNPVSTEITEDPSLIVKGVSNAQVEIIASGNNSATIVSRKVTVGAPDNRESTDTIHTFDAVTSPQFTVQATDSRGYTTTEVYTLDASDYEPVTTTTFDVFRAPLTTGATLVYAGYFYPYDINTTENVLTVEYRAKEIDGVWSDWVPLPTEVHTENYKQPGTEFTTIEEFNYNTSYVFELRASDLLTESTTIFTSTHLAIWGVWHPEDSVSNNVNITIDDGGVIEELVWGNGQVASWAHLTTGKLHDTVADEESIGLVRAKILNNPISGEAQAFPVSATVNERLYTIASRNFEVLYNKDTKELLIDGEDLEQEDFPHFELCILNTEVFKLGGAAQHRTETKRQTLTKYVPRFTEAIATGFNMLLDEPYAFANTSGGTADMSGIAPQDLNGNLRLSANGGEALKFVAIYTFQTDVAHKFKWQWRYVGSQDWTILQDWTEQAVGVTTERSIEFIPPVDERVEVQGLIRIGDDEDTMRVASVYFQTGLEELRDLGDQVYNLETATGMFSYKGSLGLYGVKGAENSVFISLTQEPTYFPVPHGMFQYDTEVLHVINYLEGLLIITRNEIIYQDHELTKILFTGLNISALDAKLACVIKAQVYLKIGYSLYVIVPNAYTSDVSDLKTFKVSEPIEDLLVDINNLKPLLNKLFETDEDYQPIDLVPKTLKSYVEGDHVHLVHGGIPLSLTRGEGGAPIEIDFVLTYNTVARRWTFQLYDSLFDVGSTPFYTREGTEVRYSTNSLDHNNLFITRDKKEIKEEILDNAPADYLGNWQMLNTGIVPLLTGYMKRLRELQLSVKNDSEELIQFYTNVVVDGRTIASGTTYQTTHDTDPESPTYGNVYITPQYEPNVTLIDNTVEFGEWYLDYSRFPGPINLIAHLLLYGKGRHLETTVIHKEEKAHTINKVSWILRIMNAR